MTFQNNPAAGQANYLRRTIIRLKRIIVCLIILLLAILAVYIYNHWYHKGEPFIGRVDDVDANPNMHNYRRGIHLNRRSMGVYYPIDSIRKYLDVHLPKLIQEQEQYQRQRPGHFNYKKYKWVLGFYWMKRKDTTTAGNANKLGFYVMPTLVDTLDKIKVLDYYNDKDSLYYHGNNITQERKTITRTKPDGLAFDEGQLWP